MDVDALKARAALSAMELVKPGMRIGLGTGSTARHFVEYLGRRVAEGLDVICVPTSNETLAQAHRLAIPLAPLDDLGELDLTVDGADEIAPDLSLVKGGGGALLREKIVAAASRSMVVVADESKWVDVLGRFPLPIEVVDFAHRTTRRAIEAAGAKSGCPGEARMRRKSDGSPFVTDNGNLIFDAMFQRIDHPEQLAARLSAIPGVVEHGLFIGLAQRAFIAAADGVRVVERS